MREGVGMRGGVVWGKKFMFYVGLSFVWRIFSLYY